MSVEKSFVTVARVEDIPEGSVRLVARGRARIVLARVAGTLYALDAACSHIGASLAKGRLQGDLLECPLHGSRFDLRTGSPQNPPAFDRVRTYDVRVEGDDVQVGVLE